MFYPASPRQRKVAVIVCLAIVAYFGAFALVAHYEVDLGRQLGYCGFKQRTNLPCPTCGMTTATLAFAQGHIAEAFLIQPAAGLLYCATVLAGALAFFIAVFGVYFNLIKRFFAEVKIWHMILALIIILASGWAVTVARAIAAQN
ncbi:MAG: DUF2752 domain-containing protein [Planctomycetota bacterium]|nr:DUF2752 domain-containing protein [Planctomycetota bacterium]